MNNNSNKRDKKICRQYIYLYKQNVDNKMYICNKSTIFLYAFYKNL